MLKPVVRPRPDIVGYGVQKNEEKEEGEKI
jgi:hypothetical protein